MVGGTVWHMVGGARNAPSGQMFSQAISRTKARVPILGGSFAVWGMLFSCSDCTFTYIRKKEDPWNAIMSGATTGGILALRAGPAAAGKSALVGGVLLAAIEGLNLLVTRVIMPSLEKQDLENSMGVDKLEPPPDPLRPRVSFANRTKLWDDKVSVDTTAGVRVTNPLSGASSVYGGGAEGGAEARGGAWDTPGFVREPAEEGEKKSSWKFW